MQQHDDHDDEEDAPSETETELPSNENEEQPNKTRRSKHCVLTSDVLYYGQKYRKSFKELKFRSRLTRIDECVSHIIACCIEKKRIENEGIRYIEENVEFANECLNIVNGIRERLALKLKMKLPSNDTEVEPVPLVENDEEKNIVSKSLDMETAINILSESTGNGYERIRKELISKLPPEQTSELKSLYHIRKQLPLKIESVTYNYDCDDDAFNRKEEIDDLLYGLGGYVKSEEEALQLLSASAAAVEPGQIHGARLKGHMDNWLDSMVKKLDEKKSLKIGEDEDVIVVNCFDGAEAIQSEKQVKGVVSFSSMLLTPKLVNEGLLHPGSSFNILTWLQILAKEELKVMKTCMQGYLQDRTELVCQQVRPSLLPRNKLFVYDMHDGKLLYLLSQHSMWNRKNFPFILCKCRRNRDDPHDCTMWDDKEYQDHWNISKEKWDLMQSSRQKWTVESHKDWCDSKNFGITHFGIDPTSLPISSLRFDVFHLSCAVIRRMMSTIRNFMLKQSSTKNADFTDKILRTFLTDYLIYCWNNKLKFSVYKGNDLFTFLCHEEVISNFFNEEMMETPEMQSICKGLQLLRRIVSFMTISRVENGNEYEDLLKKFRANVQEFYAVGKHSYVSKAEDESFYIHCLCNYMPKLAEKTYVDHKVGLGIFTMQGFERRNKESKNTIQRFTTKNRKNLHALLKNNLERLGMVFYYEMNAY